MSLQQKSTQENLAKDILAKAKELGADQAELAVDTDKGFTVTVRMGDVESIEYNQEKSLHLIVFFGKKSGTVSISDLSPSSIQTALEKACNIARYTQEDPYSGLADKDQLAFEYPQLDLNHPWNITPDQAIEQALQCENLSRAADKRIVNSEGAIVSTMEYFHTYANSNGFIGSFPSTSHSMSCTLIASNGKEMERDYDYTIARDAKDLESIDTLAKRVTQKTVQRLNARPLSTREVPVIFSAQIARTLIGHFVSAISGSNIYRKSSFLVDHIQKPIFPKHIRIDERPHILKGNSSEPFDSEGVKTRAQDFVTDGVLQKYILGSYSARKLGMQTSGNADGVHNLFISTSDYDLSQLLKQMGRGLLVTEVIGQGVNIVTGDYSRGAFGYWVENGEIQYPVHEITIAGYLPDMYANIVAIANDVDLRGNLKTGSILIERMTIAGQ